MTVVAQCAKPPGIHAYVVDSIPAVTPKYYITKTVSYTGEGVCDVALIRYTLSSGNPRRAGNLVERVEGSNGGQRGLVYEQPGTEVDDSYHNWRVPSK